MWLRMRRKLLAAYTLCVFLGIVCLYKNVNVSLLDLPHLQPSEQPPEGLRPHYETLRQQYRRSHSNDMHVVVGYYQGNKLPWLSADNLTQDILDSNMYSPDPKAGHNGEAVIIPSFEAPKMNKLFQINRFNLLASDRVPLNRSLPDVRKKDCQLKKYEVGDLPTTSVIIVFHNEAWSTLLRTVVSVINRSPSQLLTEVILVDDASQRKFLGKDLETYVADFQIPVSVLRSPKRVGLIKARLIGAAKAKGQVLTFLDAHCECTTGWLEPLLYRIHQNRKSIVSPVIDIINDDTFQYVKSFELHQGGFNWELHFRWFPLPAEVIMNRQGDPTLPFKTPVIAGGLFSMEKNYFYELGSYDDQMDIWGGENLEISFRGWMCGATLEIVPCSHVGHIFRKSSPYSFPGGVGDVLNSNLARVASVWMDDWQEFYFKLHPEVAKFRNQSVDSRRELRNRLNCSSFSWFLENVYPTHFLPGPNRTLGIIRNQKAWKCLQSPLSKSFGQPYGVAALSECISEIYGPQLFVLTPDHYIKTDDSVCLDAPEFKSKISEVRIMACNNLQRQKWIYDGKYIKHEVSGKCLDLPNKPGTTSGLSLRDCSVKSSSQHWNVEPVKWRS